MSDQHLRRTYVTTGNTADDAADLEYRTPSRHLGASEPVPEADVLEQLTPVDPAIDPAVTPASGGPTSAVGENASPANGPVDEADWLEQQLTVLAVEGDEDYPPDLSGPQ